MEDAMQSMLMSLLAIVFGSFFQLGHAASISDRNNATLIAKPTISHATKSSANPKDNTRKPIVNINNADLTKLRTIKGIGPKKAQAIVNYRKAHGLFKRVEEIKLVKGISEKLFNKIRQQLSLR